MAKEILYSEVSKDFKVIEDSRLFRLFRGIDWREVIINANDNDGYCNVGWKGKSYKSHRIMWCLYNKQDVPTDIEVDHINRNRLDNRKENLRLADDRLQGQNQGQTERGRLVGCYLHTDGKWKAGIKINGTYISLGMYDTEQDAHTIYMQACTMLDKTPEEIQEHFGVRVKSKCTSKYKGVSLHKQTGKWQATVTISRNRKYLGVFNTEDEAYLAILNYKEVR